jgi:hypothetical protein
VPRRRLSKVWRGLVTGARRQARAVAVLCLAVLATAAEAAPFRVDGDSTAEPRRPRVATVANGLLFVWEEWDTLSSSHVRGRYFDRTGTPIASEFVVNGIAMDGALDTWGTSVASAGGSSAMVGWLGGGPREAARAQRVDPPGMTTGGDLCLDFFGCGSVFQWFPEVAGDLEARYHFAWNRFVDGAPFGAYAVPHVVMFHSVTGVIGTPTALTSDLGRFHGIPRIAVGEGGEGWAAWTVDDAGVDDLLQARRVREGLPSGPIYELGRQAGFGNLDIACQVDNVCMVVWGGFLPGWSTRRILGQRLKQHDDGGSPFVGGVFQVAPDQASFYGTSSRHVGPRVAASQRGGWGVSWLVDGLDLAFQQLDHSGQRVAVPKKLGMVSDLEEYDIGWVPPGPSSTEERFVVTWASGGQVRAEIVGTSAPAAVAAPSELSARLVALGSAELNWRDNSNNETGFQVERGDGAGGWFETRTVPANQTTAVEAGLPAGSTQQFRVRAFAGVERSEPSNVVSVTVPGGGGCTLAVGAPGGDPIARGTKTALQWSATGCAGTARIELVRPNGSVQVIAASAPSGASAQFIWNVPATLGVGAGYRVRITVSGVQASSTTFAVVAARNCTMQVLAPNGGETLQRGNTLQIRWSTAGATCGRQVDIELLRSGRPLLAVTPNTENDGSFSWSIPTSVPAGTNYKIRVRTVSDRGVYDQSNANFKVR